jgi:hypothetical protein
MTDKSPALAYDLARDVRALGAMAANLTPYLYEKELYGYLSGDLPRLTVGGLLMRLYRLERLRDHLSPEQQNMVQDARINFEAEQSEWSVHYEMKLQQELEARLNALQRYLEDCREKRASCAEEYPVQAEKRLIIEHLSREAARLDVLSPEHQTRLRQLDTQLRRLLTDGPFITDPLLQEVYPRDEFWWMYGAISP